MEITGPLSASRLHRLAPDRFHLSKTEFGHILERVINRHTRSPEASPLHIVHKSSGNGRPRGDCKALNSDTFRNRCPIPH